jgi:hypothetical protein
MYVAVADTSDATSAKLEKAAEFLMMAEFAFDGGCYDAAVSLAVSAGINASDALCLDRLGLLPSNQEHAEAARVLSKARPAGALAAAAGTGRAAPGRRRLKQGRKV